MRPSAKILKKLERFYSVISVMISIKGDMESKLRKCTSLRTVGSRRYHLNQLLRFSSVTKFANYPFSLCLQASKGCQNKEQILQERFQKAFRGFQQWLVNAKLTTAKCFDLPQNLSEVSASLQKIQVRGLLTALMAMLSETRVLLWVLA